MKPSDPPPPARGRRRGRRILYAGGLLVALAGAALIAASFFPIPVGWVVRLALERALPPDGALRLTCKSATFRWNWGQADCRISISAIAAAMHGQPLAVVGGLTVDLPKTGLWHGHFAPSRLTLSQPSVTYDTTAPAVVTPKQLMSVEKPRPILETLGPVLPQGTQHSLLAIDGLAVHLRLPTGDLAVPVPRTLLDLTVPSAGGLRLDVSFVLAAQSKAGRIDGHVTLSPDSRSLVFSLSVPPFATADLPAVPGSIIPKATVSFDLEGDYDLAANQLWHLAGGLRISDGRLDLPGSAGPLLVPLVDLHGFADFRKGIARLDSGRVLAGGAELKIEEFASVLGAKPSLKWRVDMTGLSEPTILLLLAALQSPPPPAGLLAEVGHIQLTTHGQAELAPTPKGGWAANTVDAAFRFEAKIGSVPLAVEARAVQPGAHQPIAVTLGVAPFRIGQLPTSWQAFLHSDGVDLPVGLDTKFALGDDGTIRTVDLAVHVGSGHLAALVPGMPPLDFKSVEVECASVSPLTHWRLPRAEAQLEDGTSLHLADAEVDYTADRIASNGSVRLVGARGSLSDRRLPLAVASLLRPYGIAPGEVALLRAETSFHVLATRHLGGLWAPQTGDLALVVDLQLQQTPLRVHARGALTGADAIALDAQLEEFLPARLSLTLPAGLTARDFDFPLSAQLTARASLAQGLAGMDIHLNAGTGQLRANGLVPIDLPVAGLTLDASYDPHQQEFMVHALKLAAAGLNFRVSEARMGIQSPYTSTGHLQIDPFAVVPFADLGANWLAPGLRPMARTLLQAGAFAGADLIWNGTYDPNAARPWNINRLRGEAHLTGLGIMLEGVPNAVKVRAVDAALDFPKLAVSVRGLSMAGVDVPQLQLDLAGLADPSPSFAASGHLTIDLPAAAARWSLPADIGVTGSAQVEGEVSGQLRGSRLIGRVAIDLSAATVMVPGLPLAAPSSLELKLDYQPAASPQERTVAGFSLRTGKWLGDPLAAAGRMDWIGTDWHTLELELTRFAQGQTSFTASIRRPDPKRVVIRLDGDRIDAGPWLRAAVAWADAAAKPVVPAPPPLPPGVLAPGPVNPPISQAPLPAVGVLPAPPAQLAPAGSPAPPADLGLLEADIRCGELVMAPGAAAHDLHIAAHIEHLVFKQISFSAKTDSGDVLRADLTERAGTNPVKLEIRNLPGWVNLIIAPWRGTEPGPGPWGQRIAELAEVPVLVQGGDVIAEGTLNTTAAGWLKGRLQIRNAILVHYPRILQLLANKSHHDLLASPFVEELTFDQIALDPSQLAIGSVVLRGSGIVKRLSVSKATYGLIDDKIHVDGKFFGVGFEIVGTRADPQVFLKDNAFINAIGQANEFDFDTPPKKSP